jgi:hypothetical protein
MLRSTARVIVTQQKTGLPLHFEITVQTRNSIYAWFAADLLLWTQLWPDMKLTKR